ncbi:MAG: hypothetical protein E6K93_06720 [Thaumarchaeota archaeon]|nr:MAG: hypothetical protein E6K93_06720 [Nitrososphaerota archaeon]
MTNNNSTSPLYVSKNTQLFFIRTSGGSTTKFFFINGTTSLSPLTMQSYTCGGPNDYCLKIPAGGSNTTYFGAVNSQGGGSGASIQALQQSDQYAAQLLIYGKFASCRTCVGNQYSQSLPFLAINSP